MTTGSAACGCAVCSMTPSMPRSNTRRPFQSPGRGISLTEQELNRINDVISPLLKKGQSLPTICERYRDELPVTIRTIYCYIDAGLLEARNIDLRRKLRRPERKKSGPVLRAGPRKCHIGRTYEDYQAYLAQNPDALVSQMDSVVIHKGEQVILTILLTSCDLQLMFLRERNTAASVTEIFRELRQRLGETSLLHAVSGDCDRPWE